jgi:acetyl esterase
VRRSAQCPYIYGKWVQERAALPSLAENDGYFLNRDIMQTLAEIYDPGSANIDEATCWPCRATTTDLDGLPPHVISVNEVDPLRDEGLDYRNLLAAEVPTIGRMKTGLCLAGEVHLPRGAARRRRHERPQHQQFRSLPAVTWRHDGVRH